MSTIVNAEVSANPGGSEPNSVAPRSRPSLLKAILSRPLALISAIVLALIILAVLFAPLLVSMGPNDSIPIQAFGAPSPGHLLGFDSAGRDIFSRILYGGRNTLGGAVLALVVALVIGIPTGLLAGYYAGWFDSLSTWMTNFVMSLPSMIILLASRAVFGPTVWVLMVVLGVLVAPSFYRLVRGTVASVRGELYVDAARVSGLPDWRIMARHIFTVVRAPIIIQVALVAGVAIGLQAGLEFIGVGSGNVPTWGSMLNEAFLAFNRAPQLLLWPGLALGLTSATLVLLATGVRDALDERGAEPKAVKASVRHEEEKKRAAAQFAIEASGRGALLSVRDLHVTYRQADGSDVEVVHGVNLDIAPGEVVGLVGESGSGKSQTAYSILGILPTGGRVSTGSALVSGHEVIGGNREAIAKLRSTVGYVPQEPMSNLDPSFTIGSQLTEPLRVRGMSKSDSRKKAMELLKAVEIANPERVYASYPHEISGGMAQRVLIAGALLADPDLLIADEPTTALDVTVQAEVLGILRRLRESRGIGVLIVTHNLGVVADICDRVAVMSAGKIVEHGTVQEVLSAPKDPYTQRLLGAVLDEATVREAWQDPAVQSAQAAHAPAVQEEK